MRIVELSNPGYRFENELLNALRDAFPNTFVHRFKQSKRTGQPWDLIILPPHMCVIECKSKNVSDRKTLTLEKLFREGQLEEELRRAKQYSLKALLTLELRYGKGYPKQAYYSPLEFALSNKIDLSDPDMRKIEREGGKYKIEEDFPHYDN